MLLENVEMSEETRVIVVSFSVPNAAFSRDTLRHSILDLSFARGPQAGELGSAPSSGELIDNRAVPPDILDFAARVVVTPAQAPHRP